MCTKTCRCVLSRTVRIHFTPSHRLSKRHFNINLKLRQDLPFELNCWRFWIKFTPIYNSSVYCMSVSLPFPWCNHPLTLGKEYKLVSSSVCKFLHPFISSFVGPHAFLRRSQTSSVCILSSQVSHSSKTKNNYILYFVIMLILDRT